MVSDTLTQAPMTQLRTKYTKSLRSSTGFSKWVEERTCNMSCGGKHYEENSGSVGTGGWQCHLARVYRDDLLTEWHVSRNPRNWGRYQPFLWMETCEESVNTKLLGSGMSIHLTKPDSPELARTLDLRMGFICPQEGHRHWDITRGAKKRRKWTAWPENREAGKRTVSGRTRAIAGVSEVTNLKNVENTNPR